MEVVSVTSEFTGAGGSRSIQKSTITAKTTMTTRITRTPVRETITCLFMNMTPLYRFHPLEGQTRQAALRQSFSEAMAAPSVIAANFIQTILRST